MNGLIEWFTERARMTMTLIVLSISAGIVAYLGLPKEGAPNIDVPVLYVSVPLPGVSAADSERLMVKPLETALRGLDNLKQITGFASENHAGILLEFHFNWDKDAAIADVRAKVDQAQADLPDDAEEPTINEVNLSEFPVLVVSLSGEVPERTLLRLSKDLQREIESNPAVLEAKLTGHRDEMVEVLIDPLKLESYGVTADELLGIVNRNNRLVAAGSIESGTASFSISLPGAFEDASDIYNLPIKVNGDRVIRLSDVTDIRRTFEDPDFHARFNGHKSISLQVKKRIGENIITTVDDVRESIARMVAQWPEPLRKSVRVDFSMDQSREVASMVTQLQGSVATAVIMVMMVVLVSLGFRSAILVGLAIPCSFLLSFALMSVFSLPINNMVMFGLILAVGMLVDGAIVVVEYADKRITAGQGPMRAYGEAAKRMFWPIVASTATTLCAFLPMLFWPGIPGKFMEQLPITLIFVLTASLIVALVFLPVMGGVAGRISRWAELSWARLSKRRITTAPMIAGYRRTLFGRLIGVIVLNPLGPVLALVATGLMIFGVMQFYVAHNNGVEFFVKTEPEKAIIYVRARGNLSLDEADRLVRMVETRVLDVAGVRSVFAFSGLGGLETSHDSGPEDAIGQVQIELAPWNEREHGDDILNEINRRISGMPGIITEISLQEDGPNQGKPLQLELRGANWQELIQAAHTARMKFGQTQGLINIDDTLPLPGIEWKIRVDRAVAGRYGADVATTGPLVQFLTRGALLGSYRPDDSDDEIDIRMRFPAADRHLSTIDTLKLATEKGKVPLSNFISREPGQKLGEIQRHDGERFLLVRADVDAQTSDIARIEELEHWIETENPFPPSVSAHFTGDREEQAESQAFLLKAFIGALGLMFFILLAQFNSLYHSLLVLSAVIMSVAGVLVGMIVMGQKFSIIMTGIGIVALAGIVVNNNIVLIDTFQELRHRLPTLEAIVRTAEARIRPVLLTTITTMAGLMPMMFALSLDFENGGISQGAPTALWWVQLATAVVFGLGFATVLTLVVTPAALALPVWLGRFAARLGQGQRRAERRQLYERFSRQKATDILWVSPDQNPVQESPQERNSIKAAE